MSKSCVLTMNVLGSVSIDDWQGGAIASVSSQINRGYTSGEVLVFEEDEMFRVHWELLKSEPVEFKPSPLTLATGN